MNRREFTPGPWYIGKLAGDHQGLVISEATGATVALTYDKKDAGPIAALPSLMAALQECITDDGAHCLANRMNSATALRARIAAINAAATAALRLVEES